MTSETWRSTIGKGVAAEIRQQRKNRGLSVQELSDACTALGSPVTYSTLVNLENGRRISIDLADLLLIAKVLDLPPISLIFPPRAESTVESLPGRTEHPWEALAWFAGETPRRTAAPEGTPQADLDAMRAHSVAVHAALVSSEEAARRRRIAATSLDQARSAELGTVAEQFETLARQDWHQLRGVRATLRAQGLTPPPLPEALRFVDDAEEADA